VSGVPICIASIEDMITLKEGTGRKQDHDDIEHLRRIKGEQS
jgi:predicted nucleotidyltransferase